MEDYGHMSIPANQLKAGMFLDLEGDPFATTTGPGADEQERLDNEATIQRFEYEYVVLEKIVQESPDCTLVECDLLSFACPPYHQIKVATYIAEMADGVIVPGMTLAEFLDLFKITDSIDNN